MKTICAITLSLLGASILIGCSNNSTADKTAQQNFKEHKAGGPPPASAFKPHGGQAFVGKPSGPVGSGGKATGAVPPAATGPGAK